MNDLPNREVVIFTEAIQLPAAGRAAYLEQACGGDARLRAQVDALLQAHDQVGDFLEQSPQKTALDARLGNIAGEKAGDRVGRYKLLQQIGEGGCGVVYMAEQEEPVRRRVALKIIKPGMDTKSVIARFEAERQALALMDHPNIAKVFDAGATESGRPYFVMELVRGVAITEYCDQHALSTEERLELFIQVCKAVQHAHQKGIIHRDIKPSNILVTTTLEGAALPVVIDFGIAKATTNQRLTDKTLFTAFEMLIGTPAYMSPEQAALTSVDVDTRTDIYSLGVLLYELLTSSTPFDTRELLKAGLDEIRRVIREEEPARPSTRLSKMPGVDLTTVAQRRRSEPPRLIRAVCGDLDWIAMKALEKDRTRRYETAAGLALDIQRYLANETISARPPSQLYKLQKTVSRHKLLFAGLGTIALFLVVSLIVVSTSLGQQRQARREAEAEAVKSEQVTQFLKDTLQGVGPSVARGRDTTMLREILDRTAERIDTELTNQPAVQAELSGLIGQLYLKLGNYDGAEKMQRTAVAINRKLFGTESPALATALNDLGLALRKESKLPEAESAHHEALVIRRKLYGNTNAEVATSLNDLATVFRHQNRLAESAAATQEALAIRRKLFGETSLEVADVLHNLCILQSNEGKPAESEATAREMLAMRRKLLGNEDPLVAAALGDLAWAANGSGKLDEAEAAQREALAIQRKLMGDEAPDVAKSFNSLGQLLARRGNLQESHAVLQAALSIQRKLLGDDNPEALSTLRSVGLVLESEGKLAEAEAVHREALALWHKRGGDETPQALAELENLAQDLKAQKKFSAAAQLLDTALTPLLATQPSSGRLLALRCDLKARQSKWSEAAADAALAFEYEPLNYDRYAMLAALLIKTQNRSAYEQLRHRLLAMAPKISSVYAADQMAKACLLLPPSPADLPAISQLADRCVTVGSSDAGAMPFFAVCKALSEYRLGHYPEAAEWAQKPLQTTRLFAHEHAYPVLAMAQWQQGAKAEARAMLARGNELVPASLPERDAEDLDNAWQAWLFARISLDEAAALIPPETSGDRSSK